MKLVWPVVPAPQGLKSSSAFHASVMPVQMNFAELPAKSLRMMPRYCVEPNTRWSFTGSTAT
jgi:hypothetical protein